MALLLCAVFNYAANHTVEQSNSFDTYLSCDSTDNNDTTVLYWSSEGSTQSVVPLTSTGTTYFLCTAYDGSHCLEGMRFPITVAYGQGLPPTSPPSAGDDENQSPDLNNGFQLPPPPPPGSVPSTSRGAHPPKGPQLFNLICLFFFSAAASMGALL
ncbi:hypothetical protein O6H91_09G100100 [Diphasiastrum complanatum]|uniref:Uncharacterized protein n=1 Tax=Diphasiastrum complanatum TaxID=34168 RepID=A0ACC2CSF6_DIPCM|nr:hypothetical protein O6H91_09G100100 [Diphasiastrum complanatum]